MPLKEKDIVDRQLLNDIFYKIPEIHVHHELLLSSLKAKFDVWDTRQTVGDILLNIVRARGMSIEIEITLTSQLALALLCVFLLHSSPNSR